MCNAVCVHAHTELCSAYKYWTWSVDAENIQLLHLLGTKHSGFSMQTIMHSFIDTTDINNLAAVKVIKQLNPTVNDFPIVSRVMKMGACALSSREPTQLCVSQLSE